MSYARIDDLLPHHRKVRALGPLAFPGFGLYVASVAFAQRELTDGIVLRSDLPAIIPGQRPASRLLAGLVEVHLWDALGDGRDGWRIHDYLDWNDSAAIRRAKLAKDALRKRGAFHADSARTPDGVRPDSVRTSSPLLSAPTPLHSAPLPEGESEGGRPLAPTTTRPAPGLSRDQTGPGSDGSGPVSLEDSQARIAAAVRRAIGISEPAGPA